MMVTHYINKALEILRKEGFAELLYEFHNFVKYHISLDKHRFKFNTFKNNVSNRLFYDAPPNNTSPIFIDPDNVEYRVREFSTPSSGLGKIKGGNWDDQSNLDPITSDDTIKGIRQHFQEDMDWDKTVYYEKFKRKYNGNEDKVTDRCAFVESLYDDIKNGGYKPASESSNKRQRSGYGQFLEVLVVIGRDGRIHHQGKGSHRLGISKLLDIKIPVQVLIRHKKWQELRNEIQNNGFSGQNDDKLRGHPDLQDVLD